MDRSSASTLMMHFYCTLLSPRSVPAPAWLSPPSEAQLKLLSTQEQKAETPSRGLSQAYGGHHGRSAAHLALLRAWSPTKQLCFLFQVLVVPGPCECQTSPVLLSYTLSPEV